jgi:hypothetical protein
MITTPMESSNAANRHIISLRSAVEEKCKNWIQQYCVLLGSILDSISNSRHTTQRDRH